jgi:hypothetical protein
MSATVWRNDLSFEIMSPWPLTTPRMHADVSRAQLSQGLRAQLVRDDACAAALWRSGGVRTSASSACAAGDTWLFMTC